MRDRVLVVLEVELVRGLVIDDGGKRRWPRSCKPGAGLTVIEREMLDLRHESSALDAGDLLDAQLPT